MTVREISLKVRKLSECIASTANKILKESGLTYSQIMVLSFLFHRKGEDTALKDIENHLDLTHPTVIGLVSRLESGGFVKTCTSSEDRRIKLVTLTQKSYSSNKLLEMFESKIHNEISSNFTENELEIISSSLDKLYKIIKENMK